MSVNLENCMCSTQINPQKPEEQHFNYKFYSIVICKYDPYTHSWTPIASLGLLFNTSYIPNMVWEPRSRVSPVFLLAACLLSTPDDFSSPGDFPRGAPPLFFARTPASAACRPTAFLRTVLLGTLLLHAWASASTARVVPRTGVAARCSFNLCRLAQQVFRQLVFSVGQLCFEQIEYATR